MHLAARSSILGHRVSGNAIRSGEVPSLIHADTSASGGTRTRFPQRAAGDDCGKPLSQHLSFGATIRANAGMRPERRCKPGMDGGVKAASFVSPPLYLRTAVFLSNQPGPPHHFDLFCRAISRSKDPWHSNSERKPSKSKPLFSSNNRGYSPSAASMRTALLFFDNRKSVGCNVLISKREHFVETRCNQSVTFLFQVDRFVQTSAERNLMQPQMPSLILDFDHIAHAKRPNCVRDLA